MDKPTSFSSKAWLLDGPLHSLPGILHFENRKLTFLILEQGTFSDERFHEFITKSDVLLKGGEPQFPIELFSVSKDLISRFHIPWYYFWSGGALDFENHNFRFSFVKPQNTVEPTYYSESFMEWRGGKGQEEVNIAEGKSAGKTWKALLST